MDNRTVTLPQLQAFLAGDEKLSAHFQVSRLGSRGDHVIKFLNTSLSTLTDEQKCRALIYVAEHCRQMGLKPTVSLAWATGEKDKLDNPIFKNYPQVYLRTEARTVQEATSQSSENSRRIDDMQALLNAIAGKLGVGASAPTEPEPEQPAPSIDF